MELQANATILAFKLIIALFKCIILLKHVQSKKVELQTVVTMIPVFIIAHVFTCIEIFISSYGLELLSSVLSLPLSELLQAVLAR